MKNKNDYLDSIVIQCNITTITYFFKGVVFMYDFRNKKEMYVYPFYFCFKIIMKFRTVHTLFARKYQIPLI